MPSAFDIASRREATCSLWAGFRRHHFLILAFVAGPLGGGALHLASSLGFVQLPSIGLEWQAAIHVLVLAPILEELIFRGGLQEFIERTTLGGRQLLQGLTLSNVMTSLAFAAAHFIAAPPWLAVCVFVPSLVFGRLKELYSTLAPAMLVHAWFNLCYLAASTA